MNDAGEAGLRGMKDGSLDHFRARLPWFLGRCIVDHRRLPRSNRAPSQLHLTITITIFVDHILIISVPSPSPILLSPRLTK